MSRVPLSPAEQRTSISRGDSPVGPPSYCRKDLRRETARTSAMSEGNKLTGGIS